MKIIEYDRSHKTDAVIWLREKFYRANQEYREAIEWHARLDMRDHLTVGAVKDAEQTKAERAAFVESCRKLGETQQEWLKVQAAYDMIVNSLLKESVHAE